MANRDVTLSISTRRAARRMTTVVAMILCSGLIATALVAEDSAPLGARLKPLLDGHQGKTAILVRHLETGEEYSSNADMPMPTASLIKFPVMVAAYRLADEGKLDLDRMLTLRAEDKVIGSGILTNHFSEGASISLRDAIRLMIAFSDNTATNMVLDQIGLKTTAETMEQLGFSNTKIHAKVFRGDTSIFPERSKQFGLGSTTPAEMVKLLELLDKKKLASPAACEAMMAHLLACEDKEKLPRELPPGTKVAHKTGSVNKVRTDAGILITPAGRIAVCIMTSDNEDRRWSTENAADRLCGRIGRVVYDHFNPPSESSASIDSRPLVVGATGPLVESLQRTLNRKLDPSPELSVDGDFGPATRAAVARFQKERKLEPTGEVGPETWAAIGPLQTSADPVPEPAIVNSEKLPRDPPEDLASAPLVTCKAWAIADGNTGRLIASHNEKQLLPIASTTKIMTAYVVLKLAEHDPSTLDEVITFSRRADETLGTTADLRAGERVAARELLYGLLLPSGNDASVALAEHFGSRFRDPDSNGDADDPLELFVQKMNRTARSLGMTQTHYANPHGLTQEGHVSTAADLLILAHASRQLSPLRDYVATRQRGCRVSSIDGYERDVLWKNTNKLLAIDGYDGIKTGTTDAAGACLVSSGRRGGDERLIVVLGSANSDARYVDTRNLFRWTWSQAGD